MLILEPKAQDTGEGWMLDGHTVSIVPAKMKVQSDFFSCTPKPVLSCQGGALLGIAAGAVIGGAYGNQRGGMAAGSSMGGFYGSQSADNEKHMVLVVAWQIEATR